MKKISLILILCIYFPVYAQDNTPEWYLKLPDGKNIVAYYAGFGSATNIKVAGELALTNALKDLASALGAKLSQQTKEFIDEVAEELITNTEEITRRVVSQQSIGGFKIVRNEEHSCGQEFFCSYILIEYPLSADINQENKLNNINTKTEDTNNTVPSWYLVPQLSDEHYYYFSGFGINSDKNKSINLAVIDSIKLLQNTLNGKISTQEKMLVVEENTSVTKELDSVTKIRSENFMTNFFYYIKSDQEELVGYCKDTSFQEDYEKSENVFRYFLDYTCESSDFIEELAIAGKIPQNTLIHYRWGNLEKIKTYKQADGNYAAYVLIKHDAKEFITEYKIKKKLEMEKKLIASDAFKELEEEINKTND